MHLLNAMKVQRCLVTFILLATLTACGTRNVSLSKQVDIGQVGLNPTVTMPEKMTYYDLKRSYAMVVSMAAAYLVDKSNRSTLSDLRQLSDSNNISVAEIVRTEFASQWKKKTDYALVSKSNQQIDLEVVKYGLSVSSLSNRELVPLLRLRATMRDGNGNVLWRNTSELSAIDNPVPTMDIDAYFVRPDYLRSTWSHAAKQVVSDLVGKLL